MSPKAGGALLFGMIILLLVVLGQFLGPYERTLHSQLSAALEPQVEVLRRELPSAPNATDLGEKSPPPAAATKIRLSRPYVIYNVSGPGVLLDSLVPGQKVPEVPRGVLYMPMRWRAVAASDINTVILVDIEPLESVGYKGQYSPYDPVTVKRWRYFMWAFDAKNGTLGASTSLDDPRFEEFAENGWSGLHLHLFYSDLCNWADSVTVGALDDWCLH